MPKKVNDGICRLCPDWNIHNNELHCIQVHWVGTDKHRVCNIQKIFVCPSCNGTGLKKSGGSEK